MKTHPAFAPFLASTLLLSSVAHAAPPNQPVTANFDKAASGQVSFTAVGRPSMLKIKGIGAASKGSVKIDNGKASGELSFDMTTLDTGMSLRNKHMKEKYLEVDKFPTAKLTLSGVKVPDDFVKENFTDDRMPFEGTLTVHGKDARVSGTAKLSRKGGTIDVDATFETKTTQHGIPTPSFAGITVGENVTMEVVATGVPLEGGKP